MNTTQHIVEGLPVYVVDGAVEPAALSRSHALCRMLPFTRIRYGFRANPEEPLGFDYQWIHPVAEDERAMLPLDTMATLVQELAGDTWAPGRVHINCITPGERRHQHIDGARDRVLVAVCFANASWDEAWAGDLVFFDDGVEVLRVSPAPGRIIIFDGSLVHRGGVPIDDCPEVRYAIAHKFLKAA
jgi:hypothetical protein